MIHFKVQALFVCTNMKVFHKKAQQRELTYTEIIFFSLFLTAISLWNSIIGFEHKGDPVTDSGSITILYLLIRAHL